MNAQLTSIEINDLLQTALQIVLVILAVLTYRKALERFFPANEFPGFHAIFLTNGQVYFGKIARFDHEYIKLVSIFYLQVGNGTQSMSDQNSIDPLSLVKLGNELHGPDDAMFINRSQVLFWENLREDGKVMDAIRKYQRNI